MDSLNQTNVMPIFSCCNLLCTADVKSCSALNDVLGHHSMQLGRGTGKAYMKLADGMFYIQIFQQSTLPFNAIFPYAKLHFEFFRYLI